MWSHAVLVGLMGTGKSTVGRLLADRLGVPMRDSDAAIQGQTGQTVRELAVTEGVGLMHEREAKSLLDALGEPEWSVICAAASTIDRDDCRTALAGAFVVWLQADPAVLAGRFGRGDHRPRFGTTPEELLDRQAQDRNASFRAAADLVLDATEPPETNAGRVLAALRDR